MTIVRDVSEYIQELSPLAQGVPGDEYGLLIGEPEREVRRGGTCWLADSATLARMEEAGVDMIISHEHPWMRPPRYSPWFSHEAALEEKQGQKQRRAVYGRTGMALFRIHSPWDIQKGDGVRDQCAKWLGLGPLLAWGKYTAVYRSEPIALGELVARITSLMPPDVPARLFGPPDRVVSQVGLMWGGFGWNQMNMAEEYAYLGAEVLIKGDCAEEIALSALELDIPVIEVLHSLTEEPGMRRLAEILGEHFPNVQWGFYPSGATNFYGVQGHTPF